MEVLDHVELVKKVVSFASIDVDPQTRCHQEEVEPSLVVVASTKESSCGASVASVQEPKSQFWSQDRHVSDFALLLVEVQVNW